MIGLEDRQDAARNIFQAHSDGARLRLACEIVGIDLRTLQRWKAGKGLVSGDGRPGAVHPVPAHALSPAERAQVLSVANEPRFADVPPVTDRRNGATDVRHFGASNRWVNGRPEVVKPRVILQSFAGQVW